MGGPTGHTKNAIIVAMYTSQQRGHRISVTELATEVGRKISTVSEHLSSMSQMHPPLVQEIDIRGQWELTPVGRSRARSLHPSLSSIEDRGLIAAGPAKLLSDVQDVFDLGLDPDTHFAFHVEGDSMIEYNIKSGAIAILRRLKDGEWPAGKIVAALVPEGTDVNLPDWQERLKHVFISGGEAHEPELNHITLKKIDWFQPKLHGSQGTIEPVLFKPIGVLLYTVQEFPDGRPL